MIYSPSEQECALIQSAFDERAIEWNPRHWDYTEWEEFSDQCRYICGKVDWRISIDTSFVKNNYDNA